MRTRVHFRPMTDAEIRAYIATGEPMDKAGSYGIQGYGAIFVDHLEGDYFSVMGLRQKKAGKSSCGANCAHCAMHGQCHEHQK